MTAAALPPPVGNGHAVVDAVVVGAGPNGLAAAVTLALEGCRVVVLEAGPTIGGGARTEELTLPGFHHDVCSAVHPLGIGSPFLRTLPLAEHGLEWVHPDIPLAHPLEGDVAAALERSLQSTAAGLGTDGGAWRGLFEPLVDEWDSLAEDVLAPLHWPRRPGPLLRMAAGAARPAEGLAHARFAEGPARALFAGIAAHGILPLTRRPTSAVALLLGAAGHAVGWPFARGGAGRISAALGSLLTSLGGEILTGREVSALEQLPPARAVLLDVTPRQLLRIAGPHLNPRYRRRLAAFRYGPGVFKVDWALDGPIPWRAEACRRAGTIHVGGDIEEVAAAERAVHEGRAAERPFVLVAQPTCFDPSRAPAGKHVAWAYCHVPNGWSGEETVPIEEQIERYAPGFRERIVGRSARGPREIEAYNPNCIGGDIAGGMMDVRQSLARPLSPINPYTTPLRGVYLCSSSTPPGPGVHGMCGHHAARAALRGVLR
ncbi:MAG TPA: NAD(P)/FAD-dependent oxidoreductase [Gemmatimonadota bacterium]|nr:NAD(P)/FAD-dependent oxidoreductase [Gemmatimonadota bacterium]